MGSKVELLAPAGNAEAFYGAIHAGADAVYLGGRAFGARAYADNFETEEIVSCIRYAHLWNRKVYLTVNTLVKEKEWEELYAFLEPLCQGGLDGVIVQDLGVLSFIRQFFPDLALHASTQMTVTGVYGARLLKKMGIGRIVPARELSLSEVKKIKEESGLEVECFIHGAMCYCYSGQCLFSSMLGGRSGNRGRCAQPCRLSYRVGGGSGSYGEECFPLSLKDMCTLEILPQLLEAGIDSLKIEGRMKKPEYAAGVTAIYRNYIDKYLKGERGKPAREDLRELESLYLRTGRQDGYYFRQNGKSMVTMTSPSYNGSKKEQLARIRETYLEHFPKKAISGKAIFQVGSPAELILSCGAVRVQAKGAEVQTANRQPITCENIQKQMAKLGDTGFYLEQLEIECGEQAFCSLKEMNELRRTAVSQLEDAILQKNGFQKNNFGKNDLHKTDLRKTVRDAKVILEDKNKDKSSARKNEGGGEDTGRNGREFSVLVKKKGQLSAAAAYISGRTERDIIRIYVESSLFLEDMAFVTEQCGAAAENCECVAALPYILRAADEKWLQRMYKTVLEKREIFTGFLVRNLEELSFLQEMGYRGNIYTDAGLYVWNHYALEELREIGEETGKTGGNKIAGFCMPLELRASEKRELVGFAEGISVEQIIYGRIPMMITANCLANTTSGCRKGTKRENELLYLKDRKQKEFPVQTDCRSCMNIIYNCVPLSLHGEEDRLLGQAVKRLQFTIENEEETLRILSFFAEGAKGTKLPFSEYTTGHEKRGVE